jgi:hypothetical protein
VDAERMKNTQREIFSVGRISYINVKNFEKIEFKGYIWT